MAMGRDDAEERSQRRREQYQEIMEGLRSSDENCRVQAAMEIRRLTKSSPKLRRQLSATAEPLVEMLRSESFDCQESALLALLNLAVMDERNKIKIVDAGALPLLVAYLQSPDPTIQSHATAALLTLTASPINRPQIGSSGAIPHLFQTLTLTASAQTVQDSITALANLSTTPDNLRAILSLNPVPAILSLLVTFPKPSKTAEKSTALLESLLRHPEARHSLTATVHGVLSVVEVLEEGTLPAREHAVGALLTLCESNREEYRAAILNEGAIPGLLQLTVEGTLTGQMKARKLLHLLRDATRETRPETAKCSPVDDVEKARKMMAEMVQVSMRQSLRHIQRRALIGS